MTTREELVDCALGYIDTPFGMGGRSKRRIDCIGLPLALARDLAVENWEVFWADTELHEYRKVRPPGFMRAKLQGFVDAGLLRAVSIPDLQLADMVLRSGHEHDHHVSITYLDDWVIEASNRRAHGFPSGRVRKVRVLPSERAGTFVGGYQFPGVL